MSYQLSRFYCTGLAVLALSVASIFAYPAAHAQDKDLVWDFSESTGDNGGKSAELVYHVPQTDAIKVYATCGGDVPPGEIGFLIGTETGDLKAAEATRLRFSGGGKEYEFEGKVAIPESGEGTQGASIALSVDDPLWNVLTKRRRISYQIPGFAANTLRLGKGKNAIKGFVEACQRIAKPVETAESSAQASEEPAEGTAGRSGGPSEREAFAAAKEFDSPEAWQAFLKVYPEGFYAELAKAYLAKSGDRENRQVREINPDDGSTMPENDDTGSDNTTQQAGGKILEYYSTDPGSSRWYNFDYVQDEGNASTYAAGVKSGGLELFTWCTRDKTMGFQIRRDNDDYPKFEQRIEQGLKRQKTADLDFVSGGIKQIELQVYGLTGEVGSVKELDPNGQIIKSMISGNVVQVDRPPFGAAFQLNGSKKAICDVIDKCGASSSACISRAPVQTTAQGEEPPLNEPMDGEVEEDVGRAPATARPRCGPRQVFVAGRGCVRRRNANAGRCPGNKVFFEGQCMSRQARRAYCGPGFVPRRGRCVSLANAPRRPNLNKCAQQGLVRFKGRCVTKAQRRKLKNRALGCAPGLVVYKGRCLTRAQRRNAVSKAGGCPQGLFRFKGSCMTPAQRRAACGPGFRPRGRNNCVPRG